MPPKKTSTNDLPTEICVVAACASNPKTVLTRFNAWVKDPKYGGCCKFCAEYGLQEYHVVKVRRVTPTDEWSLVQRTVPGALQTNVDQMICFIGKAIKVTFDISVFTEGSALYHFFADDKAIRVKQGLKIRESQQRKQEALAALRPATPVPPMTPVSRSTSTSTPKRGSPASSSSSSSAVPAKKARPSVEIPLEQQLMNIEKSRLDQLAKLEKAHLLAKAKVESEALANTEKAKKDDAARISALQRASAHEAKALEAKVADLQKQLDEVKVKAKLAAVRAQGLFGLPMLDLSQAPISPRGEVLPTQEVTLPLEEESEEEAADAETLASGEESELESDGIDDEEIDPEDAAEAQREMDILLRRNLKHRHRFLPATEAETEDEEEEHVPYPPSAAY